MASQYDIPWHMLKGLDPANNAFCTLKGSVTTGMEPSARDEITVKLRSVAYCARGRVFFDVKLDQVSEALKLRSLDHIHVLVFVESKFGFVKDKAVCLRRLRLLPRQLDWKKALCVWQRQSGFHGEPHTRRPDSQLEVIGPAEPAGSGDPLRDMLHSLQQPVKGTCPEGTEAGQGDAEAAAGRGPDRTEPSGTEGGQAQAEGTETRARAGGTETQTHAEGTETQTQAEGTEIRSQAEGTETQAQAEGTKTQAQAEGTETQAEAEGTKTQAQAEGTETPAEAEGTKTQAQAEGTETQAQAEGTETQAQAEGTETPAEAEGTKTQAQVEGTETPAQAEGTETRAQAEGTETQVSPPEQGQTGGVTVGSGQTGVAGSVPVAPSAPAAGHRDAVVSFRATCFRAGGGKQGHAFTSNEGAENFGGAVQELFNWKVQMKGYDLEVILDVAFDMVTVGLSLTPRALFYRNLAKMGPTSLRSTVCYNLLMMAKPQPYEVVVDPLCGGGSISLEGVQAFPGTFHLCGDNYPEAAGRVALNREFSGRQLGPTVQLALDVLTWDCTRLPLRDACADVIVSDLPFGKRMGSKFDNRTLYPACMEEMARICTPRYGRAVLLTQDKRTMEKTLHQGRIKSLWRCRASPYVNIGGLDGCAYFLQRTDYVRRRPPPPSGAQQPEVPPSGAQQPEVPPSGAQQPEVPPPSSAQQPEVPPSGAQQPEVPPPSGAQQPEVPPSGAVVSEDGQTSQ